MQVSVQPVQADENGKGKQHGFLLARHPVQS